MWLPYPLDTCFALFVAYKDHGILAHAGGYLDQPRAWQRVISLISRRYNPIHDQWLDQQRANGGSGNPDDDDPYRWLPEMDGAPAATGWDALKGGS